MRRFDFDSEAAIRLHWQGVPAINVATPVRYFRRDEGGISHFNYLRDNLLLTAMYCRLAAATFPAQVPRLPREPLQRRSINRSDHPAVDGNDLGGNIAGLLRCQKPHQFGHLVRRAGALHRHQPGDLLGTEHPSAIGDAMMPGATALTVMPRLASSSASERVAPCRPALAAA